MKQIAAVVQKSRLYAVLTALRNIESMPSFIVSDAGAFPRGHARPESASHGIDALDSFAMVKVECVVPDRLAAEVVERPHRPSRDPAAYGLTQGQMFVDNIVDRVTP